MSVIYLLRHGQASFGAANYDQLSPLGFEQAGVLGAVLRERLAAADAVVVSGTMERHRQTATGCLAAMNLATAPLIEDAGFNEYDHVQIIDRFMDRQTFVTTLNAARDRGRAFEELFMQGMTRWQSGAHDGEYDEAWPAYRARCLAALDRLATRLESSQTALVFTSGGVIATIAQQLLEFPMERFPILNWRLANAGISKLVHGSGGAFLSTLNEHGHFEGERKRLLSYR